MKPDKHDMRGATSLQSALQKGGSLVAPGSNLDPIVSLSVMLWWRNSRGNSHAAPPVSRNGKAKAHNYQVSRSCLFVLLGWIGELSPLLFTHVSHTCFFSFFFFFFDFYIPLHLQSKPMRGKINNGRVDACHHIVCLARWVINVFCQVLCKAGICPLVLVRHCCPNVH